MRFSSGVIFRSSVWLGFPSFVANISVANGTDVWPSVFCVGSAVGTGVQSCLLCSHRIQKATYCVPKGVRISLNP